MVLARLNQCLTLELKIIANLYYMWTTAPKFLWIIAGLATLAGLVMVVAGEPVLAQHSGGAFINNPTNLSSLARRQYVSGKREESLALYQKAIEKAEQDYGKSSPLVSDLSYEMGVRAYDLCKFDLAERCLKKAAAINPNSLSAQLMLGQLLRFRNRNSEAYAHIEQALNKHWDAVEARKDLMLCLQDIDPASAAQQALIINCLQNGSISKIPARERPEKAAASNSAKPIAAASAATSTTSNGAKPTSAAGVAISAASNGARSTAAASAAIVQLYLLPAKSTAKSRTKILPARTNRQAKITITQAINRREHIKRIELSAYRRCLCHRRRYQHGLVCQA
jgi:tetratricopeptide (TPR) repeat protein